MADLTHVYLTWEQEGDLDAEIEAIVFLYHGLAQISQTVPLSQKSCRFEVLRGGKYHVEVVFASAAHRTSRSTSLDFTVPLI